jgi:ferredoxin-nitrite reductase
MPRDLDNPYGIEFRGRRDRGLKFVRPYRNVGELNDVEKWKLARHPFEVAQAVIDTYSKEGPASISRVPGEQERLKWVGMYPQRQGGDAFMMRIKVPGGMLTAPQVRAIGVAAEAFAEGPDDSPVFGNRYADLTTRQDVQLHWIRIADVPRIWQRLWDVGLTTVQACGDSARNVCSCPVSGIDADEVVDALGVAQALSAFFTGNREYANLPRKWKIAVSGCTEDCARVEINDVGLWPAEADGNVGFNVLVGGGLSDGERMASDIDVFIRPDQAVELCRGVAQVFGELGNRENRGLARMRYLVQELGPEGFRAALAERSSFALEPSGRELTSSFRGDHVGVHPQKQHGLFYVGCSVPVGRMHGIELVELARLAQTYGDGGVRIGTDQNFIVSGVPEERLDDLLSEPLLQTYSPFPGPFERGVVACTGSEFCRFAVVETKERAVKWARALDAQLSNGKGEAADREDAGVIRMHFSGCSASCAQPQIADIGFRGDIAHVDEHIEEAVDIGLGGSLGPDAAFIDWVAGAVPVERVPDALVRLVTRYQGERREGEPFHLWARRIADEDLLATVAGPTQAAVR